MQKRFLLSATVRVLSATVRVSVLYTDNDFPRYYLKEDSGPQANYNTETVGITILRPKSYEGFTVMSSIFNHDYS